MLSPAIPCHYHKSNIKMESMLVCHVGALWHALHSLKEYYTADPSTPDCNMIYPYPTSFTSWDGSSKCFWYVYKAEDHDLFFSLCQDDSSQICIKFTSHYCKEAHEFLAAEHFAPALHAVECLPGGLYMIVMANVSKEYVSLSTLDLHDKHLDSCKALSENIWQCLQTFHLAGFMHGDVHNTNIMVKKQDQDGSIDSLFLLVDFDFSGKHVQVQYPLDLNTTTMWQPKGMPLLRWNMMMKC